MPARKNAERTVRRSNQDAAFRACHAARQAWCGPWRCCLLRTHCGKLSRARIASHRLRYLLLALRPPSLMILNKPETNLHPDLLAALGRFIVGAARQTQVLLVSHAPQLISTLKKSKSTVSIELKKEMSETKAANFAPLELPAWHWPPR